MCAVRLLSAGGQRAWPVPPEQVQCSAVLQQCAQAGGGNVPVQHSDAAIEAWLAEAPLDSLSDASLAELLQV
jgi:hypothetical protein